MRMIIGPCAIESLASAISCAWGLKNLQDEIRTLGFPDFEIVYKSSFSKANRSSIYSFHGVGIEVGLDILQQVKKETGLKVTTDFHSVEDARLMEGIVDIYQVPHSLCRYTEILKAAAKYAKEISVKKGTFLSAKKVGDISKKLRDAGFVGNITLIHRGDCFGRDQLVMDMADFRDMKKSVGDDSKVFYCCDATHCAQDRDKAPILALSSILAGADTVFLEAHPYPSKARCDGASMIDFSNLKSIILDILTINELKGRLRWRY